MKLVACPACGGRVQIVEKTIETMIHGDIGYMHKKRQKVQIQCSNDNCPVGIKTRWFGSVSGALNAWNDHVGGI